MSVSNFACMSCFGQGAYPPFDALFVFSGSQKCLLPAALDPFGSFTQIGGIRAVGGEAGRLDGGWEFSHAVVQKP